MARRRKSRHGYRILAAVAVIAIAVAAAIFLPGRCSKNQHDEASYEFGLELAIPQFSPPTSSQTIEHIGYTVSYSSELRNPYWVAYELTSAEVSGKEKRTDKFVPDPLVKGTQASNADYSRSGWDKGHHAPAADMGWSKQAMEESFYMSNISPQEKNLNRGAWKHIEKLTRDNATRYGKVLVVTGPVFNKGKERKTIGKNKVAIPDAFYKVLLVEDEELKGIGFYCENIDNNAKEAKSHARSIDEIEEITGIDFFHKLPDDIEERVESAYDWKHWNTGGGK